MRDHMLLSGVFVPGNDLEPPALFTISFGLSGLPASCSTLRAMSTYVHMAGMLWRHHISLPLPYRLPTWTAGTCAPAPRRVRTVPNCP